MKETKMMEKVCLKNLTNPKDNWHHKLFTKNIEFTNLDMRQQNSYFKKCHFLFTREGKVRQVTFNNYFACLNSFMMIFNKKE